MRVPPFVGLSLSLCCALLIACGGDSALAPAAPSGASVLVAVTAPSIAGAVGTALSPGPTVRATDRNGIPVEGVKVTFELMSGPTLLQTTAVLTGIDGSATVTWMLHSRVGLYSVIARAVGLPKVVFTVKAHAGPVARITRVERTQDQWGVAGTALASPLSVLVADRFDNPIAGATVTFTVVSGGGAIEGPITTTDSSGAATSGRWTLGQTPGEQQVSAQAGTEQVLFTSHAVTAMPCEGCAVSGELAFVRDGHIYLVSAGGAPPVQLTTIGVNSDPAWSPDGRRIAFVSERGGSSDIYVMNADGSEVVRRTNTGKSDAPAWSPDGRKIAFSSWHDGNLRIYSMTVDQDSSIPVALGYDRGWNAHPAWSPDGSKIAFVSDSRAYDFVYDLYVMDADGSNVKSLVMGPFSAGNEAFYFQPAWSPDGRTIAVVVCAWAWDNCYPHSTLVLLNADGSVQRVLAQTGGFASPTWSPDGRTIAYSSKACSNCSSSIHQVAVDGTGKRMAIANGHSPAWRP